MKKNIPILSLVVGAIALSTTSNIHAATEDDPLLSMVLIDQLEQDISNNDNPLSWSVQAWLGQDLNKLWITTEGEQLDGETLDAEVQAFYSRALTPYWDWKIGFRKDFKPTPSREWAVVGVQGLTPYYFEIDAALFVGNSGNTALRLEAEYELLITQKLILTPEVEINLYGQNDPATGTGSGLSELEAGLRLRYEIVREFAPYIGVNWSQTYGNTANLARSEGESSSETKVVLGLRTWF